MPWRGLDRAPGAERSWKVVKFGQRDDDEDELPLCPSRGLVNARFAERVMVWGSLSSDWRLYLA